MVTKVSQSGRTNKIWTAEETQYLRNNIGIHTFPTIAKHLNRTPEQVIRKADKLGLSIKKETGLISMNKLVKALHMDDRKLHRWVKEYGLPLRKKAFFKPGAKQPSYYIDPIEFWDWAEVHKDMVNFAKIEPGALDFEPEWVEEVRKIQSQSKSNKRWTEEEDQELMALVRKGYSYNRIGIQMGRTYKSIEKRFTRLIKGS